MSRVNASESIYEQLSQAYEHFNNDLFDGGLPQCVFSLRAGASKRGCMLKERWRHSTGKSFHELAINSKIFDGVSLLTLFQTIVHEQCKLHNFIKGRHCRQGYHDKNWAETMESVGLVPSHNGKPGGRKTGQRMSSYIDKDGSFFSSCIKLLKAGFTLDWVDTKHFSSKELSLLSKKDDTVELENVSKLLDKKLSVPEALTNSVQTSSAKSKIKYSCSSCNASVWGKPGLKVRCISCNTIFEENV